LKYQQNFANAVLKYIEDEVPSILVTIDMETFRHNFDNLIELKNWGDLEYTAKNIFGEN
jgi:hypothetical protein